MVLDFFMVCPHCSFLGSIICLCFHQWGNRGSDHLNDLEGFSVGGHGIQCGPTWWQVSWLFPCAVVASVGGMRDRDCGLSWALSRT